MSQSNNFHCCLKNQYRHFLHQARSLNSFPPVPVRLKFPDSTVQFFRTTESMDSLSIPFATIREFRNVRDSESVILLPTEWIAKF